MIAGINEAMETVRKGLDRLECQLLFAEGLLKLRPDDACSAETAAVRRLMSERAALLHAADMAAFTAECEGLMPRTAALAKSFVIHFVSHAHIDMNWMWSYDETVAITRDTFRTMLTLMDRYPDFTYSQSQASVYKIIERYDTGMLQEIRRRVGEGRWEVSSCTWVEGDKNMASGESQVRQALLAKRYLSRLFGLDIDGFQLDYEPDTFGHNLNVPAILSRAGVRYYYHCRGFDGPRLYRWVSLDGSALTCYLEKGGDWYNYDITPLSVIKSALTAVSETGLADILRVYGVGDHGGGPTVRDIEAIKEMAEWPVFPRVKFSTYKAFFAAVEAFAAVLPEVRGEHNFVFTGCYSSQSEIKKANRLGEKYLFEAEAFAATASLLDEGFEYPSGGLDEAWESVLFNQFHDILPGSGRRETREYALGKHQEVMAAASVARGRALQSIGARISGASLPAGETAASDDRALGAGAGFWQQERALSAPAPTDGAVRHLAVFNPCAFQRSEVVETVVWDLGGIGAITVVDARGERVVVQELEEPRNYWGHSYQRVLFEADVPAFGYASYTLSRDPLRPPAEGRGPERTENPSRRVLENDDLRLEMDIVTGALSSLFLKEPGLEMVPQGDLSGLFRIVDESSTLHLEYAGPRPEMTAWMVGAHARVEPISGVVFLQSSGGTGSSIEKSSFHEVYGPLRQGFVWTVDFRRSRLTTAVYLQKGSGAVHFDCRCDWLEVSRPGELRPQLNIEFPLPLEEIKRTYEVPFAAVERDVESMDLPALRWVDASGRLKGDGREAGLMIYTDSKYGYRTEDGSLMVTLLRATRDPDPFPELGEHDFSLAVIPHAGPCRTSGSYRTALGLDQPLIAQQVTPGGDLPASLSFLEIDAPGVVLSALKKPEDGPGLLLRLFEVEGRESDVSLRLDGRLFPRGMKARRVDLLERPSAGATAVSGDQVSCRVGPGEIVTLLIESV